MSESRWDSEPVWVDRKEKEREAKHQKFVNEIRNAEAKAGISMYDAYHGPSDTTIRHLLSLAQKAAEYSYSPYSKFPVGAAVLGNNGRTYQGCNVENASYGLAICAERVALFSAIADGVTSIEMLAVCCAAGNPREPSTLMPCGACRQVMQEFMSPEGIVSVDGVGIFALRDLLPTPFYLPINGQG